MSDSLIYASVVAYDPARTVRVRLLRNVDGTYQLDILPDYVNESGIISAAQALEWFTGLEKAHYSIQVV